MIDADFINQCSTRVVAYGPRARERFGSLDAAQLNWCPGEGQWSVAQCLDHLVTAHAPYLTIFHSIADGTKTTTFWERLPVMPGLWGKLLVNAVSPETKRKAKAPKAFQPRASDVPASIVEDFCAQQDDIVSVLERLKGVDLDTTNITSPIASFITYSLRDAITIIVEHEERHLRQAERVLEAMP